jgi:hypothetical protein
MTRLTYAENWMLTLTVALLKHGPCHRDKHYRFAP